MIVMQYANGGSLLSYLDQHINRLTWTMKLRHLKNIAYCLHDIHSRGLIHSNLHGGNILFDRNVEDIPYVCGLGLSRSVNSREQNSTIRGVLPFIAPEVFAMCKFTQKSDMYSFGIIMYLIATGEPPFREWSFDKCLAMRVCEGLRPVMPDSTPEEYKKLAERCCDADPYKRPDAETLWDEICKLFEEVDKDNSNDNAWNTIYHNDVKPLSRLEKESKYSSMLLPTGDLPKPRNSYDLDSAAGMKSTISYK